jgi:hypothetical protein
MKSSRFFLPTIVGISVYTLINKLFPEKISNKNSKKDVRGGDMVRYHTVKEIVNKIMRDRALKIALISVFTTAGIQYFNQEIQTLLVGDMVNQICAKEGDKQLKIVCDIIKDHELDLHTKSMKELIVANNLSRNDKINLLKIKLDFIISSECGGKKRFFILSIISALITVCVSGVGGLTLFLEALYRLFQEGKISEALYEQILKIVTKESL